MASKPDQYTVTAVQARKAILQSFKSKRPVFIWGPPGIGKSEIVEEITKEIGGHLIDLRMAQMEPTDIRGIPFYNKDLGKWIGLLQLNCLTKKWPKNINVLYCLWMK